MSDYMRESITTPDVANAVDEYVRKELHDADKFDNRTPLDESGIFSLHLLAARIFAKGYELGVDTSEARHHGEHMRRFEADKKAKDQP